MLCPIKIDRVNNALDHDSAKRDIMVSVHTGLDSPRCDIRVRVHAVPNGIRRAETAPDYNSARCDIMACVHAVDGL